ncbi:MAG: hypothetical protein WAV28_11300 [Sedimentisphaerales bacterium]
MSRISELNFEVPKVPEIEISVYQEIRKQITSISGYQEKTNSCCAFNLITWYSDSHYLVT